MSPSTTPRTAADERRSAPVANRDRRKPPFITRWSGEANGPMPVVARSGARGIGYADERSYDRDEHGLLWTRVPSQPGRGKPLFGQVHALRQRMCMSGLRCQVCGGPADRTPEGVLWLVDGAPHELRPARELTGHPPVCRPCAKWSATACPHLRTGTTLLRVHRLEPHGVNGLFYRPAPGGPEPTDVQVFDYGDPRLPWVRAGQLVVALCDFTVLDVNSACG